MERAHDSKKIGCEIAGSFHLLTCTIYDAADIMAINVLKCIRIIEFNVCTITIRIRKPVFLNSVTQSTFFFVCAFIPFYSHILFI